MATTMRAPEAEVQVVEKLNDESVDGWRREHPGWARDGRSLVKEYGFASFRNAIVFVNRVATAADTVNHHPDIDVRFNRVRITLSTHDAEGITERDLKLAETLDFATSTR